MKKTLLALSLIGCLLISAVSCTDPNGNEENTKDPVNTTVTTVVPSGDAETPTQSEGGDQTLGEGDGETTDQSGNGLEQGGANTEDGWGPIHTPN